MIALLWRFKGILIGGAVFLVITAGVAWLHISAVNAAYHRGVTTERQAWEEVRRRAEAARNEERRKAQAIIDAQAARIVAQVEQIEASDAEALRDFEAARGGPDPVVPDAWLRGLRRSNRPRRKGGARCHRSAPESTMRCSASHPRGRSARIGTGTAVAEGPDRTFGVRGTSPRACRGH